MPPFRALASRSPASRSFRAAARSLRDSALASQPGLSWAIGGGSARASRLVAGVERLSEPEGEVGLGDADVAARLREEIVEARELDLGAQEVGAHEHPLRGVGARELDMRGDGLARLLEQGLGLARLGQADPGLGGGDAPPDRRPGRRSSAAASAAKRACSSRVESSPPVQIGISTSSRVIAVESGSGSFGSPVTKSGKEKRSWLSSRAKASAGESVRIHCSEMPHLRQPVAGRLLGARFGGALAGRGGDRLARLQAPAIEGRGEGQRFVRAEGRSERRDRPRAASAARDERTKNR